MTPAPEMLKAYVGGASIALRWSERGSPGIAQHEILRDGKVIASVKPGFHPDFPELHGNGYIDADVTPGATYVYQARALGEDGIPSAPSAELTVTHPKSSTQTPTVIVDSSAAPDLDGWMQGTLKPFLGIWYPKAVELIARPDYTPTTTLKVRIDANTPVMGTNAQAAEVGMNPNWVRSSMEKALGAVLHELTHAIQNYGSSVPGWIVEGIPDWVRDDVLHDRDLVPARPDSQMNVRGQAYLDWMQQINPAVVRTLNVKAHAGAYNEALFQQLTGKSLPTLVQEYHAAIWRRGNVRFSTGTCLDGEIAGNRAQAKSCQEGSGSQSWTTSRSKYGWVFLSTASNACLDVKSGNKNPGAQTWTYACNDGGAQMWLLTSQGKLMQPQAQRCLAIAADGASLELQDCSHPNVPTVTLP